MTFFLELFVVLSWHGMWSFEDIWSESRGHSYELTAWYSLLAGTLSNIVIYCLQFPYSKFTDTIYGIDRRTSGLEILIAHIFGYLLSLACLFSTVNTFRGYWYLIDEYFTSGDGINNILVLNRLLN